MNKNLDWKIRQLITDASPESHPFKSFIAVQKNIPVTEKDFWIDVWALLNIQKLGLMSSLNHQPFGAKS
jgi:hypothetical protein